MIFPGDRSLSHGWPQAALSRAFVNPRDIMAADAEAFFQRARWRFLDRIVEVCRLRRNFVLPFYSAPDGHKVPNVPSLRPGQQLQITELQLSHDRSRAAGQTVMPNPDQPEQFLWVNLGSRFNREGEERPNGIWYVWASDSFSGACSAT